MSKELVVAISGASGVIYGIEFLNACYQLGIKTHLIASNWARQTIAIETNHEFDQIAAKADFCYDNSSLDAPISSGSFKHDGMVIVPCSMKSLAAIACGYADTLLARAADVTIKEGRKLVLVTRETPLSPIHLENMLKLSRCGVTILPPVPAMYIKPQTIEELVMHTVSKIFDQIGVDNELSARWKGLPVDQ